MKYHYLNIDTKDSPTNECVFQYLIEKYKTYIKSLNKAKLMELFEVTDSTHGIDTIIKFCSHYKISVYALDIPSKHTRKKISQISSIKAHQKKDLTNIQVIKAHQKKDLTNIQVLYMFWLIVTYIR